MSNTIATIVVPIDVSPGMTATNYTPGSSGCPILSILCVGSSGSGTVKFTPIKSTELTLVSNSGNGGRLRISTTPTGAINNVEIASAGSGYPNGPVTVVLNDPYGSGGSIACGASGGQITSASVVTAGVDYSGYFTMDVSDFIEGVTYDIIPRYIEQTSGSGSLRLLGYKMSVRPFQVF
jgi:hypothetical protein